jgi:hypothetical protein
MTSRTRYPAFGLDTRVPAFLSRFYRISDDENGAAEYPDLFTHDVTFQFTSIRMSGIEGSHSAASQLTFRDEKASGNHVGGKRSASACGGKGVFVRRLGNGGYDVWHRDTESAERRCCTLVGGTHDVGRQKWDVTSKRLSCLCGIVCLGQSDETGQHASIRSASPSISGPCRCQLRVNNIIYSWINPFRRLIP